MRRRPENIGQTPEKQGTVTSAMSWTLAGSIANLLARMGSLLILSRLLAPEDFGNFSLATACVGLCGMFAAFGVGHALIQRQDVDDKHYELSTLIFLVTGGLAFLILYSMAPYLQQKFNSDVLAATIRWMAIGLFFQLLISTQYSFLTREMRFREIAQLELVAYLLGQAVPAIVLAWLGFGLESLVVAYLVQTLVRSLLICFHANRYWKPSFDRTALSDLFSFSAWTYVSSLLNYAARNADYLVLGLISSPTSVGIYSRAYTLMQVLVTTVIDSIEKVSFPALSKIQHDRQHVAKVLQNSWHVVCALYIPLGIFAALNAKEIVRILLGEQWDMSVPLFAVFSIALVFRAGYKTAGSVIRSQGKVHLLTVSQLMYSTLVILGVVIGFNVCGLLGTAIGVSLALVANYLLMNLLAARILNGEAIEILWSLLAGVGLSTSGVFAFVMIDQLTIESDVLRLLLTSFLFIVWYACIFLAFGKHRLLLEYRKTLNAIR